MTLDFFVAGTPQQQGSKAPFGNGRVDANAKMLKPWRALVTQEARLAATECLSGPVSVTLNFFFERPKSRKQAGSWKVTRPDLDKLVRAVCDSLTDAGVWGDDAQVVMLIASKQYGVPGVGIHVREAAVT